MPASIVDALISWFPMLILLGAWLYFMRQQRNRLSSPAGASRGEMFATYLQQQERMIVQQERLNHALETALAAQETRIARLEAQRLRDFAIDHLGGLNADRPQDAAVNSVLTITATALIRIDSLP